MYDVYLSMRHTPLSMYYSGWLEKFLGSNYIRIHTGFNRPRNGTFPEELAKQIGKCKNLIAILTPETFGQPDDNTSWMAYEIEAALQSGVNVIPVMSNDFTWPESLPPRFLGLKDVEGIVIEQGAFYSMPPANLEASIAAITARLIKNHVKEVVFISYSSQDQAIANQVRDMLEHSFIPCWMAPESIPAGGDYASIIPKAIQECDILLLILSANSQKSPWVSRELEQAINCHRVIIPLQIDDAPINDTFSFFLANCQRIKVGKCIEDVCWDLKESIYDIQAELRQQ